MVIAGGNSRARRVQDRHLRNPPATPTFVVDAEAANARVVHITFKEPLGAGVQRAVRIWLSDTAGAVESAVAPSGAVAIVNSKGVIVKETTTKVGLEVISNTSGEIDLSITEAGVKSYFVNVRVNDRVFSQQVAFV